MNGKVPCKMIGKEVSIRMFVILHYKASDVGLCIDLMGCVGLFLFCSVLIIIMTSTVTAAETPFPKNLLNSDSLVLI